MTDLGVMIRRDTPEASFRSIAPLVVPALRPRMCARAGREAHAVLFNALTPDYARQSAELVREAAEKAGRPTPYIYVLVSVALGTEAIALQQRAANFYS